MAETTDGRDPSRPAGGEHRLLHQLHPPDPAGAQVCARIVPRQQRPQRRRRRPLHHVGNAGAPGVLCQPGAAEDRAAQPVLAADAPQRAVLEPALQRPHAHGHQHAGHARIPHHHAVQSEQRLDRGQSRHHHHRDGGRRAAVQDARLPPRGGDHAARVPGRDRGSARGRRARRLGPCKAAPHS